MPDHYEIACEQYLDWCRRGLTRREMLLAVGHPGRPVNPTAEYTINWLARVHRLLPLIEREDAA